MAGPSPVGNTRTTSTTLTDVSQTEHPSGPSGSTPTTIAAEPRDVVVAYEEGSMSVRSPERAQIERAMDSVARLLKPGNTFDSVNVMDVVGNLGAMLSTLEPQAKEDPAVRDDLRRLVDVITSTLSRMVKHEAAESRRHPDRAPLLGRAIDQLAEIGLRAMQASKDAQGYTSREVTADTAAESRLKDPRSIE